MKPNKAIRKVRDIAQKHPCIGCEHFMGFESVETMDTQGRGYHLHVDIPICGYDAYILARYRCENFAESALSKDIKQRAKIKRERDGK